MKSNSKKFIMTGIDVSKWQGVISFGDIPFGVQFMMIRDGYGETYLDPYFYSNARGCEANAIPYGVYHYFTSTTTAGINNECSALLSRLEEVSPSFPIAIDMEEARYRNNPTLANALLKVAADRLEEKGYYVIVYTNKDFYDNVWDSEVKKKYDIWYARYTDAIVDLPDNIGMFQYTSKGSVNGIKGNVDMNKAVRDYDKLIKEKKLNRIDIAKEEEEVKKCCGCCTCNDN